MSTPENPELLAAAAIGTFDPGNMVGLIREAADATIAAAAPVTIGDHTTAIRHPNDWTVTLIDDRQHEDHPRERSGDFKFTNTVSLAAYVNRYGTSSTVGYIADLDPRNALRALKEGHCLVRYVLDDFPAATVGGPIGNRHHRADLILTPTSAAIRWAGALGSPIGQQDFVDLIDDGTAEIAAPAAAELRDLISDLHAIRTTSAKSIIRTGGGTAVEVAENAQLHAGIGSLVEVPSKLTLVLRPWVGIDEQIQLDVKIRPQITREGQVVFTLAAPDLADALDTISARIADALNNSAATSVDLLHARF